MNLMSVEIIFDEDETGAFTKSIHRPGAVKCWPATAKNKFPFREVKTFQNGKHRTEGLKPLETRCLNRFLK
jgi:hypothetical protein